MHASAMQAGEAVMLQSVSVIVFNAVTLSLASPTCNDDASAMLWQHIRSLVSAEVRLHGQDTERSGSMQWIYTTQKIYHGPPFLD
jgi:hypothetical protein